MSGTACLRDQRPSDEATMEFSWELHDVVGPNLKEGVGIIVDLCCECGNLVCCVKMFV